VGQVEAFTIEGLKFWFNSSDHLPPHLHVKRRGDWEIRVFFLECTENNLDCEQKWGRKGPSAINRAAILKAVLEHRVTLLEERERKVCKSN
jgi:Domain of unknown function (DUF4160)